MPARTAALLGKNAPAKTPEHSRLLRASIGLAVLVAIAGVVAQDLISTGMGFVVLAVTPVGFYVSWLKRESNQISLKILLAALLLVAFANFLRHISGAQSIDDARAPLAEIFLWVQTLHSFDQPRRKDLNFSLAASAALVALGGSVSVDASFLMFFVPWGAFGLAALGFSHLSEVREHNIESVRPGRRAARTGVPLPTAAAALVIVLLAGTVTFLFAPRGRGMQLQSLPFQIKNFLPLPQSSSGVVNPGLPNSDGPGEDPATPAPGAYFGFANFVDLRTRGRPSDEIVMRVRASQPAFWRGAAFDSYSGSSWTNARDDTLDLDGIPIDVPPEATAGTRPPVELVQTFYLESTQSNLIFAAYHPRELWFPGGSVEMTSDGSLRAGFLLEEGLVYSVVSDLPVQIESDLEWTPDQIPDPIKERYTKLPADLPDRVRNLAEEIAGDEATIAGKAEAIDQWLSKNTKYLLDIPPQPRGTDAVDYFLFEDRRGYCEQIASAMAVMLRSLGVPTRLATGYDPGERNVFSGFYEVRAEMAHSWVEVWMPAMGWVQYDPTSSVPLANPSATTSVPGLALLKKGAAAIGQLVPDGLPAAAGRALRSGLTFAARNAAGVAAVLAAIAGLLFVARKFKPQIRARIRRRKLSRLPAGAPNDVVVRAFGILEEAGAEAGFPRAVSSTPSEYARLLEARSPGIDPSELSAVIRALENMLYAGVPPSGDVVRGAEAAARSLADRLVGIGNGGPISSTKLTWPS